MELQATTAAPAAPQPSAILTRRSTHPKTPHQAPRGPRITIITVAYNSATTIANTLRSVAMQQYDHIEHIIVDGGSKDATVHIAESFPHVARIISQKDKGIYDAMNKGLALATGDIIGFLNSDDEYANELVLSKVAAQFEQGNTDTVYGDLQYVDGRDVNRVLRNWVSGRFRPRNFRYGWMPPHPTFFARKEAYQQAGGFNLGLRSAADYELMLRFLFRYRFTAGYLPEVLVKMRAGGASNGSLKKRLNANREDRLAWQLNDLRPYFFTLYLKPARKVVQYLNKEQLRRLPLVNLLF